jgi:hypothetical protein
MRVVGRLLELGVVPTSGLDTKSFAAASGVIESMAQYISVTGLTFSSDDVTRLGRLKWNDSIRAYADNFQVWLTKSSPTHEKSLWESIAEARSDSLVAKEMSGYFKATSRTLSLMSLVPGLGTVAGVLSIATDAASEGQERRSGHLDWYQLGPEVERYRRLVDIDAELSRRGLR